MKQLLTQSAKELLGRVEGLTGGIRYGSDELIVLCMHSTPADRMGDFEAMVKRLTRKFRPVCPTELDDYFSGKPLSGPGVLFTFDDGLKNNLHAAQVLNAMGINALFFLVPDFIRAESGKKYYLSNIRPVIQKGVDKQDEDFTPMNRTDIEELLKSGHFIGSHTMTHLLRKESSSETIEREVIESKSVLAEWFGVPIRSFCSPISTDVSVNAEAKRLIDNAYDFHFTTFPALNAAERNPRVIYRRNIEVHWSWGRILFALGKRDLPRWQGKISEWKDL